ncbi:MAG: hypothetical protein GY822_19210 [Deltaproteobacteria bacterium]|nr:hypothetical protein [Deltaproteobacteria bacterium]
MNMQEREKAKGLRKERIQESENFVNGVVKNAMPTAQMENVGQTLHATMDYLDRSVERVPAVAPPVHAPVVADIAARPSGLQVTWLGHSTMLVAIDGALFLTVPVFSRRVSPVQWAGPARFHAPPLSISQLPPLDGVVLSHDHYDHLDKKAVL